MKGHNIKYKSMNVWGQLVLYDISSDPRENIFRFKFLKTKYQNGNIGIGIVDRVSQ